MFALILILILLLPGVFFPLALRTLFTPRELSDMGISLEDSQPMEISTENQVNCAQSGSLYLRVKLSY